MYINKKKQLLKINNLIAKIKLQKSYKKKLMQVIQEKYSLNNLDKCVQNMFSQVNWMPIIIRKNEMGWEGNRRWFCFFCVIFESNFFMYL